MVTTNRIIWVSIAASACAVCTQCKKFPIFFIGLFGGVTISCFELC